MASKTISQLSSFEKQYPSGRISNNDLFLMSKNPTPYDEDDKQLISLNLKYETLMKQISADISTAIKNTISDELNLRAFAWVELIQNENIDDTIADNAIIQEKLNGVGDLYSVDKEDLNLDHLARGDYHLNYVEDLNLHKLASCDYVTSADLVGNIHESRVEFDPPLKNLSRQTFESLTLSAIDENDNNAYTKSLNLKALSHKDLIITSDLSAGQTWPIKQLNTTDLYNFINSTETNKGYRPRAATTNTLGSIKTSAIIKRSGLNEYGVQLDKQDVAYVTLSNASSLDNGLMSKEDYQKLYNLPASIPNVTQNARGMMSANDKKKLDDLENYILPTATQNELGGIKIFDGVNRLNASNDFGVLLNLNSNAFVNIPPATTALDGLMSANDKKKLDDLENYALIPAKTTALGGILLYSSTDTLPDKSYRIQLDSNNKAYVTVPWENTTYKAGNGIQIGADNTINVQQMNGMGFCTNASTVITNTFSVYRSGPGCSYNGDYYYRDYVVPSFSSNSSLGYIVNINTYLKTEIKDCGNKIARQVMYKAAGSNNWKSILRMEHKISYFLTLLLKPGDMIRVTGYCSANHATDAIITVISLMQ